MNDFLQNAGGSMIAFAVIASLAASWLARAAVQAWPRSPWAVRLAAHQKQLALQLLFVRAPLGARALLFIQAAAVMLTLGLLLARSPLALVTGLLAIAPRFLLDSARQRRVQHLERQIEGWLGSLARALEASPSLGEALEVSASTVDAPMKEELEVLCNEIQLGRPLDRALSAWCERVHSRTLTLAVATLQVGRETGGRLGDVLKSAAESLREMERLEGVVRTKTAEGRAQAWVISAVPVPLYLGVKASDPSYFTPLETTPTGHLLLAIAVALWIAAAVAARRILAVQI